MSAVFIYVTTRDRDEALRIGKALVEQRLAACINVIDDVTSVYRWQGAIQEDREAVLVAKTSDDRVMPLVEHIKSLHSYDCPCVTAAPIVGGNPAFLDWIREETRPVSDESG